MSYPAAFTRLAPAFGQSITLMNRPGSESYSKPEEVAAMWINLLRSGNKHQEIEVSAVDAAVDPQAPLGLPLIDKLIQRSSHISSGNVYSNIQFSQIIPAFSQVEVNGYKVLDGKPLMPGDLFSRALKNYVDAISNAVSRPYGNRIEKAVRAAALKAGPDSSLHVHSFQHKRTNGDGLIPHGVLVVSDRGELLYESTASESPYSGPLIERAVKILTCERSNERLLLQVKGGELVFVAPGVEALAEQIRMGGCVDEMAELAVSSDRPN